MREKMERDLKAAELKVQEEVAAEMRKEAADSHIHR